MTDRVSWLEVLLALSLAALTIFAFLKLGPVEGICTALVGAGIVSGFSTIWTPPPPKPPLPAPSEQTDPVAWAVGHDSHRYDPGYWTGGRIDPLLRSSKAYRYGFMLLFGSFMTLALGAFIVSVAGGGLVLYLLLVVVSGVELAAGWALLRRGPRR